MRQKDSTTALCGDDHAEAQAFTKALRSAGYTAWMRNRNWSGSDFWTVKTNAMDTAYDTIWNSIPHTDTEAPRGQAPPC